MKLIGLFIASLVLLVIPVSMARGEYPKVEKKEKIIGTVIAQYSFQPCIYHPCALWLIVRVEDNKAHQLRYVEITVEYFPDKFPSELVEKAKEWQFEAVRDASRDTAIKKYLTMIDSRSGKDRSEEAAISAWKLLPGAENEKIPVGEVLPYYFVGSGKYEAYRK